MKGDLTDRHWAGSGIVLVERKALREYMNVVGLEELPNSGYDLVDLEVGDVRERVKARENEKVSSDGEC